MQWIEAFGYLGALMTLATFSMKTMLHLRMVGIVANLAFISYGVLDQVYPVLLLVWGQLRPRPVRRAAIEPAVTVLIPAYNEAGVIDATLRAMDCGNDALALVLCDAD